MDKKAIIYCKQRVFSGERGDFGGHTCTYRAVKNGLCNFHQPEKVQARRDKLEAKWKAERDASNKKYAKQERDRELLEMLPQVVARLERLLTVILSGSIPFGEAEQTRALLAKLEEA